MNVPVIKNIEELFQLGTTVITRRKIKRLTAPGENYGSLMLSVELTVGDEVIHAVVKMVPPNEFIQKVFNTEVTFRNEIAFYKNIIPLLQNFQREYGQQVIDFAPKYHGSRLSLKSDQNGVDGDAAIVLENLKLDNYATLEQTQGLGLDSTKLILSDLAHLHAVSLALKLQKPDVFEKEVKPFLVPIHANTEHHNLKRNELICVINQIEELVPLKERILSGYDKEMVQYKPREPFATIIHNDLWINNTMVKFDGTKPIKNKIVDYQMCIYGSPAIDLVFFLFTSVKNEVLQENYDNLVKYYHGTLCSVLKELSCEISFTFEDLLKEVDHEAKFTQFAHVAFMLIPIFAQKKHVVDISEFKPESMAAITQNVTDLYKQKFIFVVNEFLKRNWV